MVVGGVLGYLHNEVQPANRQQRQSSFVLLSHVPFLTKFLWFLSFLEDEAHSEPKVYRYKKARQTERYLEFWEIENHPLQRCFSTLYKSTPAPTKQACLIQHLRSSAMVYSPTHFVL